MEKYSPKFSSTGESPNRRPVVSTRPKSSPSLRSNSTIDEEPPAVPSYQQRRLQRHGSVKYSRPTTATLRQHSRELIYQNSKQKLLESKSVAYQNNWQKVLESKSFVNQNSWKKLLESTSFVNQSGNEQKFGSKSFVHQPPSSPSSPRREAWEATTATGRTRSTTVDPKPLLRPQTAVLLRRRLRHIVKNRIKSAHPFQSNSFVSDGEYVEEDDDVQYGSQVVDLEKRDASSGTGRVASKDRDSLTNGPEIKVTENTKGTSESVPEDKPATTRIIGWNSAIKSKTVTSAALKDVSSRLLERLGSEEAIDSKKQNDGDGPQGETGSSAIHSKSEESPGNKSQSLSPSDPHNDISNDDPQRSKTPATSGPADSSTSPASPASPKSGSDDEYTPPVPELRLGNADVSIALTSSELGRSKSVQNQQRKASVAAMMRRNKHSRHHRLSVYLRVSSLI